MPWLHEALNVELLRLSDTPVTPLTLIMLLTVALAAITAGPAVRRVVTRLATGRSEVAPVTRKGGRFGTFAGVFTPSVLTILGVVMYLRVGWVVGNVGLAGALLIVIVSHVITLATALSLSSIATNRTVGVGGAYFIISRSLGSSMGAAIGIPLFLGQALSVTFYIVGFTESLSALFPGLPARAVSSLVLLIITLISLKSADLALKMQYFVMGAIVISLVSFFSGWTSSGTVSQAAEQITWWTSDGEPFAKVFAVFFPAVTGIMAGVGMSGDLKDPRTSLPRGTMWAVLIGFIVYMALPVWLALNATPHELVNDNRVVWTISRLPAVIYVGVWGATLSSAVGSILTAPRTLQALANDGMVPRLFGRGFGPNNEPRLGVVLTFVLAEFGVLMGGLDAIAPVLTMFFLATYGLINLACALEKWAASPSFRPDFKVPAMVSLLGGLGCIYVMSIINTPAMLAATVFCAMIYLIAQRRVLNTTYGDARHGIWSALVRSSLQHLRRSEFHPLNWRPNLLILGGDPEKRPWLLTLGSSIVQDRGMVTYVQLLTGTVEALAPTWRKMRITLDERIHEEFPNVFARAEVVSDKYRGAVSITQAYGLGVVEANTVLLGWPTKGDHNPEYIHMLRDMVTLDRSLLIVQYNLVRGFGKHRRIDIWWGGMQQNGGLMLLVAFLLTAHHSWQDATVTIRTVVDDEGQRKRAAAGIRQVTANARLSAKAVVLLRNGRAINDIMHQESAGADLVIAGMRLPKRDNTQAFFERMNKLLAPMPTTILVQSARNFAGEPVLFDEPT